MFKIVRNDLADNNRQKAVAEFYRKKAMEKLKESAEKMVKMMETMGNGKVHPQVTERKDKDGYEITIPASEMAEASKLKLITRAKALFPTVLK